MSRAHRTHRLRGLALLPGVGFVSASHDLTLRVWTLGGQTVAELLGHSALVYAVDCTASGRIVSGARGGARCGAHGGGVRGRVVVRGGVG